MMPQQMPTPRVAPPQPLPQQKLPQQQPAQWQSAPAKVRGVAAEAPAPPATTVRKFVMPSPESLGVTVNASPAPVTPATVDWNQIQARMERLNVLRYEKDRPQTGVVRVTLLLPTGDPTRGQPVVAQAETEAGAILLALQAGEAWMQKR